MDSKKYVWISCGGTGGHLSPAIALGEELSVQGFDDYCWVYKGKEVGENFKKEMNGGRHLKTLAHDRSVMHKMIHVFKDMFTLYALQKNYPCVGIISTGGGSQLVMLVFAWIQKIPVFLCEQNCVMGRANRLFSKMAKAVYLSFPLHGERAHIKYRLCGNPIRKKILTQKDATGLREKYNLESGRITLLAMGGSQGAKAINDWVLNSEKELVRNDFKIQWIHITGQAQFDACLAFHQKMQWPYVCVPFHDALQELYALSDLAVARSGAGVMSELTLFGIPVILVPYPYAKDDHQYWNGRYLAEQGAAILLREDDFKTKGFQKLKHLIRDHDLRTKMQKSSQKLARPLAGEQIIKDFRVKVAI